MNFDPAIIAAWGGLITGISGVIIAYVTSRNTVRKDEIESLRQTIKSLQDENTRLFNRLRESENRMEAMESEIEERDKRIRLLEQSLYEATQAREERIGRIRELEAEIADLQSRLAAVEHKEQ